MLNAFLYEIGELKENPMYDISDANLKAIIQLRSEYRFSEADEILELEKQHREKEKLKLKINMKEDEGLNFLDNLGGIEE